MWTSISGLLIDKHTHTHTPLLESSHLFLLDTHPRQRPSPRTLKGPGVRAIPVHLAFVPSMPSHLYHPIHPIYIIPSIPPHPIPSTRSSFLRHRLVFVCFLCSQTQSPAIILLLQQTHTHKHKHPIHPHTHTAHIHLHTPLDALPPTLQRT